VAGYLDEQLGLALHSAPGESTPIASDDRRAAELADLSEEEVLRLLQEKLGNLDRMGEA
jgi:hypothetical protein